MSEPMHIKEILPRLMDDIRERMECRRRNQHKARIIQATQDFLASKSKHPTRANKVKK